MTPRRWLDPRPIPDDAPTLHPNSLVSALLFRRGIIDPSIAERFLDERPRQLPDPAALPNMPAAAERIAEALHRHQRIAIFGDYDADGITATAVLALGLRSVAADPGLILTRLPRRIEGYGLNRHAVETFADAGVDLLIAVDCGSSDGEVISHAHRLGMDVIVLDHHQMHGDPPADAIVVSAQLGPSDAPARDLSGVGVAWFAMVALNRLGFPVGGEEGVKSLLDLVAIGTLGDVVPVGGWNRALIRDGLRRIRLDARPGIAALANVAGVDTNNLTSDRVIFALVPRLNAPGRLNDPQICLALLLSEDIAEAHTLAAEIDIANTARKAQVEHIAAEALAKITVRPDDQHERILVVAGEGWPTGMVGLIASRLTEQFGRPSLVLAVDGDIARGSARSVPGFDVGRAIEACRPLILRGGGHAAAGGLTIETHRIPELTDALAARAADWTDPLGPTLRIDADAFEADLTLATAAALAKLAPFGHGNDEPVIRVRGLAVQQANPVGAGKNHLQLRLGSGRQPLKGIMFNAETHMDAINGTKRIDVAATIEIDRWNNQEQVQLRVKDFVPVG